MSNIEKDEKTILQCLEHIGVMGKFQFLFGVLFVSTSLLSGYITFQFQSLSVFPQIDCISATCSERINNGDNPSDLICELSEEDWSFSPNKNNLFTEFGLYCDRMYLISLGTTIYFLGFFFSVSLLCVVVDKIGRKMSSSLFFVMIVLTMILFALSTSIAKILLVRFILGALHGGISISLYVAYYEYTSANFATLTMMLSSAGFSMGGGVSGLVAMWSKDWQSTTLLPIVGLSVCAVLFQIFVPETPYWLFAKGYESKALDALNVVAKYNGSPPLKNIELISPSGESTFSKKSQSLDILLTTPFLRNSLLCLAFCWFTVSICYYGLEFNAGSLGNEYIVMMVMGCFDFPFKLFIYYIAQIYGRQRSCQWYLGLCFLCLVGSAIPIADNILIYSNFTLKTLLVICGRAFGGSVFAMFYIYTSEILPTLVRSVGISFCSTSARIGSLLAPLVIIVNTVSPEIIYIFIVICLAISMVLLRNIPETLGFPLPNNLKDCEKMFLKTKSFQERQDFFNKMILEEDEDEQVGL